MTSWIPHGWHSVTPRLVVHDASKQVEFLRQAFAATGAVRDDAPAVMKIGDSLDGDFAMLEPELQPVASSSAR
jgi:hypothetical protein